MVRIWGKLIRPLVDTLPVRTMVEVGAEKGLSTEVLARYMRSRKGMLHSIDPEPGFDADNLLQEYSGHLTFHRDLSLNVIPSLPRFDVGLIDGDHNWYTVFNELRQIERLHEGDSGEFPVLFIHDVGWPYGRRDLYYEPSTIPEESRNDYARMGILPNKPELQEGRGFNKKLCNAKQFGGARNGVLTGVEDYVEQSTLSFRLLIVPIYYGLAVLATEDRILAHQSFSNALDELQTVTGWTRVCELGEHLRCADTMAIQLLAEQVSALEAELALLKGRPSTDDPAVQ